MARAHPYDVGLEKNAANYTPLTPLSLLARTAYVYPQRVGVIHGARSLTWSEVYARCRRLASTLRAHGIETELGMQTSALGTRQLAKEAAERGRELVLVAGGDGTI